MPNSTQPFKPSSQYLTQDEILRVVRSLRSNYKIKKIQLTGGDPLVRPDLPEIIAGLSSEGISDIALTTNGQNLKRCAKQLKASGLHRINISLDSVNQERFHHISQTGNLQKTIEGIDAVIEYGFNPVKLNTVVMRGYNDDELIDIANFGLKKGCHVRFLELMPIGAASQNFKELYVSESEIKARLSRDFKISHPSKSCGGSSVDFSVIGHTGLSGKIGFISPYSAPFCHGCNRLRLTAAGRFVGCLKTGDSIDVRPYLQLPIPSLDRTIINCAEEAMSQKFKSSKLYNSSSFKSKEIMAAIGG